MRSITASCPWKLAPKPGDELARPRATKRKAQQEVEMLALEWSKIMLQRQIDDAVNPATDPRLRSDLYNYVLNRGVGRPKPQEDEDAGGKKKGGNPAKFLEMLAVISNGSLGGAGPEPQRSVGTPNRARHWWQWHRR